MRWIAILCALAASGAEMPSGYFHGVMVSFEGSITKGVLSARAASGDVFTCGFDAKTYMEFQKHRVTVDKLQPRDPLEVLAYRKPGDSVCYVLSLLVVPPPTPVRPTRRVDMSPPKQARPVPVRHGSVNVSGVVVQVSAGSITLRTRDGEESFLLRRDTRYFGNGLLMEWTDVMPNQHLAVEGGRNSDGKLEAFQLTWGDITNR